MLFPTQEVRDTIMKMGMNAQAMSGFYARLEDLLASL
jgi:hypothetical protein